MDVHLLRIMMATNIPNSSPIEFTRSMLYNPEYKDLKGSGTYPYITDEVEYSTTNIGALTYPEMVDTFFNRNKFINMVSNTIRNTDSSNDKPQILERNVMTMLRLLFPTKYFTVNNHKQSIELLEPGISTHYNHIILYNPLNTLSSYLKINNKSYTITEVIWLNDLLNHPTYRTLLEEVYNLNRSLNAYETNLIKDGKNIDLSKQSNSRNDIISRFQYKFQNKYIRPILTTTNSNLQKYIDAKTPETVVEWIKQFEQIYKKYILKMKDTVSDNQLLNLNVNNINMEKSVTSYPTKEIFIKLTLIDGEVNDTNKSDIYCPKTNDMLGNELLNLIEHKPDSANLLGEDNIMFTVNTKTTAINYNNKLQGNNNNDRLNMNKLPAFTDVAIEKFRQIIKSADQTKLGEIINEIRKRTKLGIQDTTDSILEFINKTYAYSIIKNNDQYAVLPDLPSVINEWSKNTRRSNTMLQDKLTAMKSVIDTSYKIINDKVTDSKPNGNPADRIKLSSQLAIIGLYAFIVELLLADEKNKKIIATSRGGKLHKKRIHKTIKCKSKPRYKTHRRRYL
jgi:hypothetical protein